METVSLTVPVSSVKNAQVWGDAAKNTTLKVVAVDESFLKKPREVVISLRYLHLKIAAKNEVIAPLFKIHQQKLQKRQEKMRGKKRPASPSSPSPSPPPPSSASLHTTKKQKVQKLHTPIKFSGNNRPAEYLAMEEKYEDDVDVFECSYYSFLKTIYNSAAAGLFLSIFYFLFSIILYYFLLFSIFCFVLFCFVCFVLFVWC